MKKLIFIMLLVSTCSREEHIHHPPADLSIYNPVWTRTDPNHMYGGVEVTAHDFTLINTSNRYAYNRIRVRLHYFTKNHEQVDSGDTMVRHLIKPNSSFRCNGVSGIQNPKPGITSASVTLLGATRVYQ